MKSGVLLLLAVIIAGFVPTPATQASTVIGWGQSSSGRIATPVDLTNATALASGTYHGIALRSDGSVTMWGGRDPGLTNLISGPSEVVALDSGLEHNLVLRSDGSLVAWGQNDYGQTNIPITATNLAAISAGGFHNLGLRAEGTVVAWGRNDSGQTDVPAVLSNVVAIASGGYHSLALRTDGSLVGWGLNDYGQATIPPAVSNVVSFAAGSWHNLALRTDGVVLAWGYGGNGQTNLPAGLTNVVEVFAISRHCFALRADGSAVGWGFNNSGQATIPVGISNIIALAGGASHSLALLAEDLSPPVIVRQPASARAFKGSEVLLGVGVVTTNPPSYQWLWEANVIPGATNATLLITNVSGAQSGNYSVVVSNAFGAVLSSNAVVTVVEAAPYVFTPPQSVTTFLGGSATFAVQAYGSEPLRYQWQFNGASISGATNSTFQLFNAADSNAGNYTVVISNAAGAVTSGVARLAVPHVASWNAIDGSGQEAVPPDLTNAVAVRAASANTLLANNLIGIAIRDDGSIISWGGFTNVFSGRSNLAGFDMFHSQALAIETNGSLAAWSDRVIWTTNIPPTATNIVQVAAGYDHFLALRNDGVVIAWGSNADGQTNVPANLGPSIGVAAGFYTSAALRADGSVRAWGWGTATNVAAAPNDSVDIKTTGDYGLALRRNGLVGGWGIGSAQFPPPGLFDVIEIGSGYYHGAALKRNGAVVTWGQLSSPLPIQPVQPAPAGLPQVNTLAASGYHTLAVLGRREPVITQQPIGATIISGGTALFRSTAVGGMPLSLQWQRNGTNLSGATWPALAITNLTPLHNGAYWLVASNSFGAITSRVATLTVIPLQITAHPTNRTAFGGDATTFSVTAQSASLTYQWRKEGVAIPGATNASLVIAPVTTNHAGSYTAWVTNAWAAQESSNAVLTVTPIAITTQPANITCYSGVAASMSVMATKNGPFSYQWQFNGADLPAETNSILDFPYPIPDQSGAYAVRVGNPYGSILSSNAQLTVTALAIIQHPTNTTRYSGETLTLLVAAIQNGPFSYQWVFNGFDLPGQTNNFITYSSAVATNSGTYAVRVSNPYGTLTSSNALVTVLDEPPFFITLPSSRRAWLFGDASFSTLPNGAKPLALTWRFGFDDPSHQIPGAASLNLNLANVTFEHGGDYFAVATNSFGSTSSPPAKLTVVPVTIWPKNAYVSTPPADYPDLKAVAIGSTHVIGLRTNGTLVGWGTGTSGQLSLPSGASNIVAIASGAQHSLALRADGKVFAWGANTYGQIAVPAWLNDAIAISCGYDFSCAVRSDGRVVAWGRNTAGETNQVARLRNVSALACGQYHGLAVHSDGRVSAWGLNTSGQTNVPANLSNVVAIAAGLTHSEALRSDGTLVVWGSGTGTNLPPTATNLVALASGQFQTIAIQSDGQVLRWGGSAGPAVSNAVSIAAGLNGQGIAIIGNQELCIVREPANIRVMKGAPAFLSVGVTSPTPVEYQWQQAGTNLPAATNSWLELASVDALTEGNYHVWVSNATTSVASRAASVQFVRQTIVPWGNGAPTFPPAITEPITAMDAGFTVAIALLSNQTKVVWGSGSGQTNLPASATNLIAVSLRGPYNHLALRANGTVVNWGLQSPAPPAGLSNVVAIAAGFSSGLALKSDGTLVEWLGTSGASGISNVVSIAKGDMHTLALRADGTVRVWGSKTYGQTNVPAGLSNVVAISAGSDHSLALKSDGTVSAWGLPSQTNVPVGLQNVVAIEVGYSHSLALKSDGSVVAWGSNSQGESTVPPDLRGVTALAAGADPEFHEAYSLALVNAADPAIVRSPFNARQIVGYPLLLSVGARSEQPLHFQWHHEGDEIPGATNSFWYLNATTLAAGGNYYAVVSNQLGRATSAVAAVTVIAQSPFIVTPPVSQAVLHTQVVTLSVTAGGSLPMQYEWRKAGVPLSAMTNATLQLSNLTRATGGYYAVRVSNEFGAVLSGEANVRVIVPQKLSPPLRHPDGTAQVSSRDVDGGLLAEADLPFFSVWASSNLIHWVALPDALTVSNGVFWISDPTAGSHSQRFYKISERLLWRLPVPQLITGPVRQANGRMTLWAGDSNGTRLTPTDAAKFELHASTNLVNWSKLTNAITVTNGLLWLEDLNAGPYPRRFYRVLEKP